MNRRVRQSRPSPRRWRKSRSTPGTGQVKVKKLTTVHDSGTVLNHLSYQGQIDGGVVTGLGFALMEDNSLVDGKMATANLGEFKMATMRGRAEAHDRIDARRHRPNSVSGQSHSRDPQRPNRGSDRQRDPGCRRRAFVRSAAHFGKDLRRVTQEIENRFSSRKSRFETCGASAGGQPNTAGD